MLAVSRVGGWTGIGMRVLVPHNKNATIIIGMVEGITPGKSLCHSQTQQWRIIVGGKGVIIVIIMDSQGKEAIIVVITDSRYPVRSEEILLPLAQMMQPTNTEKEEGGTNAIREGPLHPAPRSEIIGEALKRRRIILIIGAAEGRGAVIPGVPPASITEALVAKESLL